MEGDLPPDAGTAASPGPMPSLKDFDFTPAGNASSRDNRIGYVCGKLLALGHPRAIV